MSELAKANDMSTIDLFNMAGGEAIRLINTPESVADRRQRTIHSVRLLNQLWEETGGERRIAAWDAQFRGFLPYGPQKPAIITGFIEGTAVKFEPKVFNDVERGVMARFLIVLTIVDIEGRVTVDGVPYQTDGPAEFKIDLAHSKGPFEEVA